MQKTQNPKNRDTAEKQMGKKLYKETKNKLNK